MGKVPFTPTEFLEHFLAKIASEPNTSCWLWTGCTNTRYGVVGRDRRNAYAHRVAYELFVGPIPEGKHVLHTCDTPLCVNPEHLWLGAPADNSRDMVQKGRGVLPPTRGEENGAARLSREGVLAIRARASAGEMQKSIASEYGVHPTTINLIVLRKTWKHV